jgi:hypothetical protein
MRLQACALALLFAALPLPAASATLFDPALRFRVLPTEHFNIYFHQGEERMARRLASIAEETWRTVQRPLGVVPPRRTHVVLADQTELANGYATPLPYDTIVIFPVWPSGSDFEFDDWLRLSFTHEFTHIVHLDRSEHWARAVRSLFGRTPLAFPNLFLPAWQIEGLATYEESAITGTGRMHAGDFQAIIGEAARAGTLQPLDRVNGGLSDWPAGVGAYAYGLGFHQYLVERYGEDTLAALATATARRVPYTASRAFRRVYGQPLGALWRDYQRSVVARVATSSPDFETMPLRLTHRGFLVRGPRFDRFSCDGCAPDILYSASSPDGFPALYRLGPHGGAPRRLTTRYLGSTTGIGREEIYFDQLEIRRNTGLYSDLYALSRSTGRVRHVTRDARLLDPDLSPDGTTIVCVRDRPGQRDLVTVRMPRPNVVAARAGSAPATSGSAITTLVAEADTQFDAPRWSPDGRSIAVERHRLGAMPEIVVVDAVSGAVRVLASDPTRRFVMPTWRPDGGAVVAAAAPVDRTFNLVEIALDDSGIRLLTATTGGATWPDVSPDGTTIVFAGYTADGYDVFTIPYPGAQAAAGLAAPNRAGPSDSLPRVKSPVATAQAAPSVQGGATDADTTRPTSTYSPLHTLKPTSWFPIVENDGDQVRAGASAGGVDILGYHAYAISATWLVSGPADAVTPRGAAPDWQVYYTYDRWRPRLFASASSETSFFAGAPTDAGTPAAATRRERQVEAGVVLPIRHTRVRHAALLSIVRAVDDYRLANGVQTRKRTPLHAAWETTTARTYGYSISHEDGVAVGATAEIVRRDLGSFADATVLTADARAYVPAFAPHHVLALRASGGVSDGDPTVGRTFRLGGDRATGSVVDFGSSAFSLLRGFAPNTSAGTRVALVNAEYRWPIARPQRGLGTWPLFIHSVHAAVFADAGHAWTRAFDAGAIKTSAGAELSTDMIAGYFAPFTITIGAAVGHDGRGLVGDRVTAYFRVGKGF